MNIDINNYEEYFLLYIDNELSPQERTAVEIFLAGNEEQRKEFKMLKSTISEPEREISLSDKTFLFRKEAKWINEENYEEIFVLYHDEELTGDQRLETERFLHAHPELATEFALLGKVKLEPETDLVFKDKKSLYRKEKEGKVIPIIMWRSLAAAVFLGFGLWLFVNQGSKHSLQDPLVAHLNQSEISTKAVIVKTPDSLNNTGLESEELVSISPEKNEEKGLNKNSKGDNDKVTELAANKASRKSEKALEKVTTDFIQRKTQEIEKTEIAKVQIKNLKSAPLIEDKEIFDLAASNKTVKIPAVNVNNASTASYISPEPVNDNYIFYNIPADKFKKSKVGAFLKKMKRVVDRNDPLKLIFSAEEKQIARIN